MRDTAFDSAAIAADAVTLAEVLELAPGNAQG
jgi:hypothetical protein